MSPRTLPPSSACLTWRSLRYYWRSNVAAALGVAVAVGVLVGSLLVGHSVKASLRDLAIERLGNATHALTPGPFFPQGLADREALQDAAHACAPAIMVRAAARNVNSEAVVPRVNVYGVNDRFWQIAAGERPQGIDGQNVVVNQRLAQDLGVRERDAIVLTVGRKGSAPADSVFARRDREHTVRGTRVVVAAVVPSLAAGNFTLRSDEPRPRNVYVQLAALQRWLGQNGKANVILAVAAGGQHRLNLALARALDLGDLGLSVHGPDRAGAQAYIKSDRLVHSPATIAAARGMCAEGGPACRFGMASIYLANALTLRKPNRPARQVPYSVVAGADLDDKSAFDAARLIDGSPAPTLGPGEMLLSKWAADDLGANVGDVIEMDYYVAGARGELRTAKRTFKLADVAGPPARGRTTAGSAGFDRRIVPDFGGITDARSMGDWDPPFPIDIKRIRPKDEAYWDDFGPTPKAVVALGAIKDLWLGANDDPAGAWVTTVCVSGFANAEQVRRKLLASVRLAEFGMAFRPVREQALAASRGSTDFGVLFLSMSMFLVAAAAGLVGLLLRLTVERRASQYGILLATGFTPQAAGRMLMREGLALALPGVVIGAALGVGYGWLIVYALRRWWAGAVGEFTFSLHVDVLSVVGGSASGLLIAWLAIRWAARTLHRTPALALLAGWRALAARPTSAGRSRACLVGWVSLGVALALFVLSVDFGVVPTTGAFFGIGAALLVGSLALMGAQLQTRDVGDGGRVPSLWRLALRGASRNWLRSMLTMGLLACASFIIVTVAANRKDLSRLDTRDHESGAGGFDLMARSALPLFHDLGSDRGRRELGFAPEALAAMVGTVVLPFRVKDGDDVSCLNMQRPVTPRVLGVPQELVDRGGFRFTKLLPKGMSPAEKSNPWRMLDRDMPDGGASDAAIPAFADAASAQWILHAGLGHEVVVPGKHGRPVRLRLVGLLANSVFASELLVSERQFLRHLGSDVGYRHFLIETDREGAVTSALRSELGEVGLDVSRTADTLASYARVQNTYLSTFQTLGGLGLLLGAFGTVTVLLRGVAERRGEIAMLACLGFLRRQIICIIVLENGFLLLCGLAIGAGAALVSVLPHLMSVLADVEWLSVAGTLLACVAVGIASCAVAASMAVRGDLVQALRSE